MGSASQSLCPRPATSTHTTTRAEAQEGGTLAGPPSSFLPYPDPDPRAHTPSRSRRELETLGVVLQVRVFLGVVGCFGVVGVVGAIAHKPRGPIDV